MNDTEKNQTGAGEGLGVGLGLGLGVGLAVIQLGVTFLPAYGTLFLWRFFSLIHLAYVVPLALLLRKRHPQPAKGLVISGCLAVLVNITCDLTLV